MAEVDAALVELKEWPGLPPTSIHSYEYGEKMDQRVSVQPHILVDMMQKDLHVRGPIQPGMDSPQSSQ